MMTDRRKQIALAAGYLAVFVFVFVVSIYITFDAEVIKPMAVNAARQNKFDLEIGDMSLHGLFGLDMRGIRLIPIKSGLEKARPLAIDRLTFSPKLSSVPAMLSALMSKGTKKPKVALSFDARLGRGRIEGVLNQDRNSLMLETETKDLPAQRLPIPSYYIEGLEVKGNMNADLKLKVPDQSRPNTWEGRIEMDLEKPEISDFEYMGMQMAGVSMERGTLIAEIRDGAASIETLKLQGEDLPMNLQGTLALKNPLRKSILDISGTLNMSEEYKEKNPLLGGFVPPSGEYSFRGSLDMIATGM